MDYPTGIAISVNLLQLRESELLNLSQIIINVYSLMVWSMSMNMNMNTNTKMAWINTCVNHVLEITWKSDT